MKRIIISRTDAIGDVVLTLPMAGLLKKVYPGIKIYFIGRTYTKPIIDACENIDEFINWDELIFLCEELQVQKLKSLNCDAIIHVFPNKYIARLGWLSKIPIRIGTSHRIYQWLYCNKLVNLSRRHSALHEVQLNMKLLKPLGIDIAYDLDEISAFYGFDNFSPDKERFDLLLDANKFNLILHPKSKGSAREWGLDNFGTLIELLPKNRYKIFISGTKDDRIHLESFLEKYKEDVIDIVGKMSLPTFIGFIKSANALVAASTGPLHISAALGNVAIGLFSPIHPIHPERWGPIGKKAKFLVATAGCRECRNGGRCDCIKSITPENVFQSLEQDMRLELPQIANSLQLVNI
jgi:heptosyltransferase III